MLNDGKHRFTDKEHRQHDHIKKSEEARGVSSEKANEIGWTTVNKHATLVREMERRAAKDPCWDGYEMAGTKKKNGKTVPNCVPKKKAGSDMENLESKKADALNRFLSKYAKQPFDVFPNAHETVEDPSEVDDVEFNKKADDNRALNLQRKVKLESNHDIARVGKSPENLGRQSPDKGNVVPKGKQLAKVKPYMQTASVTESLYNIYQKAYDKYEEMQEWNNATKNRQKQPQNIINEFEPGLNLDKSSPNTAVDPNVMIDKDSYGLNVNPKLPVMQQKVEFPSGHEPRIKTYPTKNMINPRLVSQNSVTEALFNIYQEAYGVQVGPGSGGNYSMGPSIDVSSPKSAPGAGTEGANMDSLQWKTKDKKIPKSKLQPGQDPIVPGKMKEAPRYTMMTPDQKVNYVKDDAGNLVNNKSNGMPKTTPGKYDRSPLTEDSLRQLYPSLYENENQQKQPGKLRQFVDWLKGIHQQTFGGGKATPDELAEQRIRDNPIQASAIQKFVKTAVADDNSFRIILAAMNEMGYTSGDILAAFK